MLPKIQILTWANHRDGDQKFLSLIWMCFSGQGYPSVSPIFRHLFTWGIQIIKITAITGDRFRKSEENKDIEYISKEEAEQRTLIF
jgi:hypothetical protein